MPIRDCPFTQCDGNIFRPFLPVRIINSKTRKGLLTLGLIDTGADECSIPGDLAKVLEYDLATGKKKEIFTGGGKIVALSHLTRFEILHPESGKVVYTTPDTPIDFLPDLHVVLLGVNSFLSRFVLNIDYPRKVFSITRP